MAKITKKVTSPKESRRNGVEHLLSEARTSELKRKIGEAVDYYQRTFDVALSPSEIFTILKTAIDRDKARLFLSKVGNISEADIIWFAEQNGVGDVEVKGFGTESDEREGSSQFPE